MQVTRIYIQKTKLEKSDLTPHGYIAVNTNVIFKKLLPQRLKRKGIKTNISRKKDKNKHIKHIKKYQSGKCIFWYPLLIIFFDILVFILLWHVGFYFPFMSLRKTFSEFYICVYCYVPTRSQIATLSLCFLYIATLWLSIHALVIMLISNSCFAYIGFFVIGNRNTQE